MIKRTYYKFRVMNMTFIIEQNITPLKRTFMKKNIEQKAFVSHIIERKMCSASSGKTSNETPNSRRFLFHLLNSQPLLPTSNSMQRKVVQMQWAKDILKANPSFNVVKLNMAGSGNLAWNKAKNPDGLGLEALKDQKFKEEGKKKDLDELSSSFRLGSYNISEIREQIIKEIEPEKYLLRKHLPKIHKAINGSRLRPLRMLGSILGAKRSSKDYIDSYKIFIESVNVIEDEVNKSFSELYGEKASLLNVPNLSNTYKKTKNTPEGKNYATFSMAGPQGLGGVRDSGPNSIENNIKNGVKLLEEEIDKKPGNKFFVGIKGHSRDAVAASQVAKGIKATKNDRIERVDLLLCDPVPGPMHTGINVEIDLNETYSGKDVYPATPELASLGKGTRTTLIYSLALSDKHLVGFTPQTVINAQRIILTTDNHTCGLNKQDGNDPNHKRAFGSELGGLKINDIDDGVYLFKGAGLQPLKNGMEVIDAIKENSNWVFDESREYAILKALVVKFSGDVALEKRISELEDLEF